MRRGFRLAPLLLLLGAADAEPALQLPQIDLIRVHKAARIMELWTGDRLVHVIEHIQLEHKEGGKSGVWQRDPSRTVG